LGKSTKKKKGSSGVTIKSGLAPPKGPTKVEDTNGKKKEGERTNIEKVRPLWDKKQKTWLQDA